jgi:serine protease AprX
MVVTQVKLSSLSGRVGASVLALMFAGQLGTAAPAQAAHRARVSADLEDHLAVGSQTIDVIVHGDRAEIERLAARYNVKIKKTLTSGAVLRVNAGQLDAVRQDDAVDHLSGDIRIKSSADVTAESIGADQVWAGSDSVPALSGAGITVAVIDSGIDTRHNAFLRKRVVVTKDFTGGDGIDLYGHGTHVAGIIAGQAGRLADTREYRGIASGANLMNLRVLGADGSGVASDVIEAIDWAIEHRHQYKVKVINLSLGAPVLQSYRDDPMCEAVERAVKAGITVVVSAGNFGKAADGRSVYGAITSPGNSPSALTVGALDTHGTAQRSDDTLATYSSKGPTRYDLIIKPDLAAPGSHVVSAEATGAYLSQTYPERHVAGSGANAYMQLSGTSMAAAVVSGSVALLFEARPYLNPSDAKVALQVTSTFNASAGLIGAGTGSVNVFSAVQFVSSGSVQSTLIGGERQSASLMMILSPNTNSGVPVDSLAWASYVQRTRTVRGGSTARGARARASSIVWGGSIVWGASGSIVWGASGSIVWGASDSIVWGASDGIVWGASDSIVWGADSIVWGAFNSIVWGAALND